MGLTIIVREWEKTSWGEWRRVRQLTLPIAKPAKHFESWQKAYAYVRSLHVEHAGQRFTGKALSATCTKWELHDAMGKPRGDFPLWYLDVLGTYKKQDSP